MKNFHRKIILCIIVFAAIVVAGESPKPFSVVFRTVTADTAEQQISSASTGIGGMSSRRTTALLYSALVPGSGQTFLGESYKGVGFTLTAFGSLLTSIISHNNFVARNERLDALEFEYANATSWVMAEYTYENMRSAHQQLQRDKNRRDLFIVITAVVWTLNIVDVLYNTEDHGESLFSTDSGQNIRPGTALLDSPHKPLFTLSLPLTY